MRISLILHHWSLCSVQQNCAQKDMTSQYHYIIAKIVDSDSPYMECTYSIKLEQFFFLWIPQAFS